MFCFPCVPRSVSNPCNPRVCVTLVFPLCTTTVTTFGPFNCFGHDNFVCGYVTELLSIHWNEAFKVNKMVARGLSVSVRDVSSLTWPVNMSHRISSESVSPSRSWHKLTYPVLTCRLTPNKQTNCCVIFVSSNLDVACRLCLLLILS